MTESRETYRVLDLALRLGEILLSSGAGAADVTAVLQAIAAHAGLHRTQVDVTFTTLRMSHQSDPEEMPVQLSRLATERTLDYDDLTRAHALVQDVLADRISIAEARAQVARLSADEHWLPGWALTLGAGACGGGVALTIGAGWTITGTAAVAGMAVTRLLAAMDRRRWPMFYQQFAGALLATLLAVGVAAFDLPGVAPSRLVTVSIVMLLAGIGFMGAIQDALTGFYITAGARILEAVLATSGLIAGVAAGLSIAPLVSLELGDVTPGRVAHTDLISLALIGGMVASSAFALICFAPLRALPAVAMAAFLGQLVYLLLPSPARSLPWAAGLAAVVIGAVSHSVAERVRVPPLVVVVPALVPLLPGLLIFRGLSFVADDDVQGVLLLVGAGATTIALAAGVILGEYAAQPLKRNVRKIERRLSAPRMVGVLHSHRGRGD